MFDIICSNLQIKTDLPFQMRTLFQKMFINDKNVFEQQKHLNNNFVFGLVPITKTGRHTIRPRAT